MQRPSGLSEPGDRGRILRSGRRTCARRHRIAARAHLPQAGGCPAVRIRSARRAASARLPRAARARQQLGKRAFRERERLFLAEGPQAVREALTAADVLTELFVTSQGQARHPELAALAASQGAPVHEIGGELMAELAQTITPQGLLGVCRFVDVPLGESVLTAAPRLVAVLASVRDPGNAGTVLRTADAAGADGVIFTAASVDPYNSKCVRASAGSLFHLPVVKLAAGGDGGSSPRAGIAGPELDATLAGLRTVLAVLRRRQRPAVPGFTGWARRDPADGLAVWQRGVGPPA